MAYAVSVVAQVLYIQCLVQHLAMDVEVWVELYVIYVSVEAILYTATHTIVQATTAQVTTAQVTTAQVIIVHLQVAVLLLLSVVDVTVLAIVNIVTELERYTTTAP